MRCTRAGVHESTRERSYRRVHQRRALHAVSQRRHAPGRVAKDADALIRGGEPGVPARDAEVTRDRTEVRAVGSAQEQHHRLPRPLARRLARPARVSARGAQSPGDGIERDRRVPRDHHAHALDHRLRGYVVTE